MLLITFTLFSCSRMENTADIPGDKNAFDPIIALPEVSAFAGDDVVLFSLEAWFIKPTGTIDIDADYKPWIQYNFIKKHTPVKEKDVQSDVPLGTITTSKDNTEKAEAISVQIIKPYTHEVRTADDEGFNSYKHGGMERSMRVDPFSSWKEVYQTSVVAPAPLPFSTIWQKAIDLGAPSDNVVANIKYDSKNGYTFEISQTNYKYKFDLTGKQID